ncbi:MAG: zinc ribbon domain protein [Siphoviridae sp. ctdEk19]|nr:MAG: zinc ribbon domain protein [Siphoviridae sp. ctdEk19]
MAKEGICPACQGTTRQPATRYQRSCRGYDPETDTTPCRNCGGQTMGGEATGKVPLDRATGKPCLHSFEGKIAGRCYVVYTCRSCGYSYDIDSGD